MVIMLKTISNNLVDVMYQRWVYCVNLYDLLDTTFFWSIHSLTIKKIIRSTWQLTSYEIMFCDFRLTKSKYSGSLISLESNIISWILMGKWYILEKNLFGVENSTKHNNSNNSLVKDEGYSEIEKIQGKQEVMLRINPTQADQNLYLNLHYDCNNLYLFFQLQLS